MLTYFRLYANCFVLKADVYPYNTMAIVRMSLLIYIFLVPEVIMDKGVLDIREVFME